MRKGIDPDFFYQARQRMIAGSTDYGIASHAIKGGC